MTIGKAIALLAFFACMQISLPFLYADSGIPFGFDANKFPVGCDEWEAKGYKVFTCREAPRSHPDLAEYSLYFVEGAGLCQIIADSHNLYPKGRIQGFFKEIESQLTSRYGLPIKQVGEGLSRSSIWAHVSNGKPDPFGTVKFITLDMRNLKENLYGITIFIVLKQQELCDQKLDEIKRRAF